MPPKNEKNPHLSAVDLNLFLVLHAVLEEGSATGAARRLHVTQSAVSNALARLRDVFGDPLVVRSGRGMVPTPRAREIAPMIAAAVEHLDRALRGGGFDPARTTRNFVLACSDNHQLSEVPRIASLFAKRMPAATLQIVSVEYAVASGGLESGAIEVLLAPRGAVAAGQHFQPLFEERAVLLVRKDNRAVGKRIRRDAFNALPYVDVHLAFGRPGVGNRMAFAAFAKAGLMPRVTLTVPSFIAAAVAVAQGDAITGAPQRFAEAVAAMLPLRIVELPDAVPPIAMGMIWHERTMADEGSRHFRALIAEAVGQAGPP